MALSGTEATEVSSMSKLDGLKAGIGGAMVGAGGVALVALILDGSFDLEQLVRGGVLGGMFAYLVEWRKASAADGSTRQE